MQSGPIFRRVARAVSVRVAASVASVVGGTADQAVVRIAMMAVGVLSVPVTTTVQHHQNPVAVSVVDSIRSLENVQ